ncbi:MAG TPA: TonB-dependent receptor, partial [Pyrinomonadaceae bacterium]|nr:TonB-dependent receptor [Pyrinomonadaceae bacterium]
AVVSIYERDNRASRTTLTARDGGYRFERLAPSEYIIEVHARDFQFATREISVRRGSAATLDFALQLSGPRAEVSVTASSTAQSVDETSKAITLIDAAAIERRDEFSVAEALRVVPGLRVQQLIGTGGLTNIKIRGLRNADTAVLIDGQRFRDPTSLQGDATSFLSDLLIVNTDRIETLRGSGSSLYGTNAIGGVLNIVTDQGGGPTHGTLQAEGGSLGLFRGRAQVAGGAGEDRFRYSAGVTHLNIARGVDGNDAFRNTSGQAFAQYNFTPSISLSGRVFTGGGFAQLNSSPDVAPGLIAPARGTVRAVAGQTFIPAMDDPDYAQSTQFFSGSVAFTQRLSEGVSYRVGYQRVDTARDLSNGPGGAGFQPGGNSFDRFDGSVDTLNARADAQLGRYQLLSAGYEFERESYDNRTRSEGPFGFSSSFGIAQRSHTFFAQDQIRLLDKRLQLSGAFRAQSFALSRPTSTGGIALGDLDLNDPPTAYTGDGSVSYFFAGTGTKLRAHAGNGYRVPSLYERYGSYGDPRLRPDRSIAFDAGVDQVFARARLRTSATYFYTRLQQVIDFGQTPNDLFGRTFGGYINTGGALARGVELSFEAAPVSSLDVSAAYTFTNADQRQPYPGANGFLQTYGISKHMLTLAADQRIGRRVDLTFDFFAASSYAFPVFNSIDFSTIVFSFAGPKKADFGASYTLPLADDRRSFRFYAKVDNIFDRTYYENGYRTPGAAFVGGTTFRF